MRFAFCRAAVPAFRCSWCVQRNRAHQRRGMAGVPACHAVARPASAGPSGSSLSGLQSQCACYIIVQIAVTGCWGLGVCLCLACMLSTLAGVAVLEKR